MDQDLTALATSVAPRVLDEIVELVAISTPSGEVAGAEQAIALCRSFLPDWHIERLPCSTSGCAPDMLATLEGTGSRRLLLLGHVDTVVAHAEHQPPRADGERLYGSGTADMKAGVAVALAVARACAELSDRLCRAGGAARLRRGVADRAVRARRALQPATTPASASRPAR